MKPTIIVFLVMFVTIFYSCSSTDSGTGEQGKWNEFTYTYPSSSDPTEKK